MKNKEGNIACVDKDWAIEDYCNVLLADEVEGQSFERRGFGVTWNQTWYYFTKGDDVYGCLSEEFGCFGEN